jgi:hypothetical protein
VAPAEPEIQHPVPASDGNDALPALDDSSAPMQKALAELFGAESVERFIIPDDLIRHIVVSVDKPVGGEGCRKLRPSKSPVGGFMVSARKARWCSIPRTTSATSDGAVCCARRMHSAW